MYIKYNMLFFKEYQCKEYIPWFVFQLISFAQCIALVYTKIIYLVWISEEVFTMLENIAWLFLYCICNTIIHVLYSYEFFLILSFVMFNPICWISYVLEEMIRGGDWINMDEVHINLWQQVLCHSAHELVIVFAAVIVNVCMNVYLFNDCCINTLMCNIQKIKGMSMNFYLLFKRFPPFSFPLSTS